MGTETENDDQIININQDISQVQMFHTVYTDPTKKPVSLAQGVYAAL